MIRINEILDKTAVYLTEQEQALLTKAYVFSAAAHAGQVRLSGEPYLSHPLEAAGILADMRLDAASIASGLLHDTVEDTKATVDELEELFDLAGEIMEAPEKYTEACKGKLMATLFYEPSTRTRFSFEICFSKLISIGALYSAIGSVNDFATGIRSQGSSAA